jgi:Ca2+-binding EF-hand superfamily protein
MLRKESVNMGCLTVQSLSEIEDILSAGAETMGFSSHSSEKVDYVIRKYSNDSTVNDRQLKAIENALQLHLTTEDVHQSTSKLLSSFRLAGQKAYSAYKLLITAILHASADHRAKASFLFEIIDTEHAGMVESEMLVDLLTLWVDVVITEGVFGIDSHLNYQISQYIKSCLTMKPRWIETIASKFQGATIDKEQFVKEIVQYKNGACLCPSSFRHFIVAEEESIRSAEVMKISNANFSNLRQKLLDEKLRAEQDLVGDAGQDIGSADGAQRGGS